MLVLAGRIQGRAVGLAVASFWDSLGGRVEYFSYFKSGEKGVLKCFAFLLSF